MSPDDSSNPENPGQQVWAWLSDNPSRPVVALWALNFFLNITDIFTYRGQGVVSIILAISSIALLTLNQRNP